MVKEDNIVQLQLPSNDGDRERRRNEIWSGGQPAMASAVARAYNRDLGAQPPAGVQVGVRGLQFFPRTSMD